MESYYINAEEAEALHAQGRHLIVGHWPAEDERHAPRGICCCGATGRSMESSEGGSAPATLPACCYPINLRFSEEDQAWIAEVPDLPGCMADGSSEADAIAAAREAIRLWLDIEPTLLSRVMQ